jgi:hypothetical protein
MCGRLPLVATIIQLHLSHWLCDNSSKLLNNFYRLCEIVPGHYKLLLSGRIVYDAPVSLQGVRTVQPGYNVKCGDVRSSQQGKPGGAARSNGSIPPLAY